MSLSLAEKLYPQKKTSENEGIFVAVDGVGGRFELIR